VSKVSTRENKVMADVGLSTKGERKTQKNGRAGIRPPGRAARPSPAQPARAAGEHNPGTRAMVRSQAWRESGPRASMLFVGCSTRHNVFAKTHSPGKSGKKPWLTLQIGAGVVGVGSRTASGSAEPAPWRGAGCSSL